MKYNVIVLTCTWGRTDITEIFVNSLINTQLKLNNLFNFKNIVIDSENSNIEFFEKNNQFTYYNYKNFPVSNKWNYGLSKIKNIDFDFVLFMGSDDIIDENILMEYYDIMKKGYDYIGINDLYFFNKINNKYYYWPGYSVDSGRFGESLGLGRCLSSRLVTHLNYEIWDNNLNRGLDGSMEKKIRKVNWVKKHIFSIKDIGIACDIKSENNITKIDSFLNRLEEIPVYSDKFYEIKCKITNPRLSIIIPTFNNVPFLTECFDSIVESIKDLDCEILVGIDNCIETKKYIQSLTFDNRFKFYFFNKNVGPYVIKNTLSKLSNSDCLLFFDSDDIMTENMIGLVLSYKKTNKVIKPMYLDFVDNKDNIKYEIKKTRTYGEGVFAVSKEVFLNVNGFQGWRCAADSEFFNRLYKGNIRPFVSQNICFYRREHPNSLTQHPDTNFSSKKRSDYIKMFSKKLVLERLLTEEYTEIIVKYHQPLNLGNNSHEIIQTSYDLVTNVINNFNPNKEIKSNVNYDLINQIINNPKIYTPSKEKPLIQNQPKNRNELNQNKKGGMAEQVKKMKMPKSRPNNMIPNVFGGRKKS